METVFLAKFFGLFITIFSLGFLFNAGRLKMVADDLCKHPASAFFAGVMPLLLGIYLVLTHHSWSMHWSVVVTLFGWALLLGGVFRLWFVEAWLRVVTKMANDKMAIFPLILGVLLLYVGFFT